MHKIRSRTISYHQIRITFITIIMVVAASTAFATDATLWTARYNSSASALDRATAMTVDTSGNVYVTGSSVGISGSGCYAYCTIKYNSSGNRLWERGYGSADSNDEAVAIALDSAGNIYVTGNSYGGNTGYDYCTIKYDSSGNPVWAQRYNGPASSWDKATTIAVDSSGNVYVTGFSYDYDTNDDYCTIKYDSSGNEIWVQRYNGPGNYTDQATAMAVDRSGNVYVTGNSVGGETRFDYCTIKYDTSGNQLWVQRYNGPGNKLLSSDYATALIVDSSGNVYVTGISYDTSYDYCTIKYDSNGNQLWVQRYNGPENCSDEATAIAIDSTGNVYVSGESTGSNTGYDYCTIKYGPAGTQLWVQRYNGPTSNYDIACAMAVDSLGNVYVTGYSYGDGSAYDYCTIKYDSSGNQVWVHRYNGPGNSSDAATAMAIDSSGNVYVTGESYGGNTGYDYCTIKYAGADPKGSVVINDSAQTTDSADVSLDLSAIVGGGESIRNTITSVRLSNDGINWSDWQAYSSTMSWTLSSGGGIKTVYTQFKDSIGNVSQVCNDSIILRSAGSLQAKGKPDSTPVWVSGVVTAVFSDSFYLENSNRSMGIRVYKKDHGMTIGTVAEVTGSILTENGERYVAASDINRNGVGSVLPLMMFNKALGGGNWNYDSATGAGQQGITGGFGLNNVGLLVKTCGKFTYVDNHTFTLDDGCSVNVKCVVPDSIALDQHWNYVSVTGISSCENISDELHRLLRVRTQGDIASY